MRPPDMFAGSGGGVMREHKKEKTGTGFDRKQKVKESFLKIIYRACQKVSDKIEDLQFQFYFIVGGNSEEKV